MRDYLERDPFSTSKLLRSDSSEFFYKKALSLLIPARIELCHLISYVHPFESLKPNGWARGERIDRRRE
jgi:hypothetical protein